MEILLMKYHQLFKKELECSFIEFSSDRSCTCPIHSSFGMNYIDIQATNDTMFLAGNRFCINIDIFGILNKIKDKNLHNKESLPQLENQLFNFFQNHRLGKNLTTDPNEFCVQLNGKENAQFLTFKIEFSKKAPKNYFTSLAQFLTLMPQYLHGNEFKYVDPAEEIIMESPTAEIITLIANYKEHFVSFINIDDTWVYFSDENIKDIGKYEDVIQTCLNESLFPFILIYKTDLSREVREESKNTCDLLQEYFEIAAVKKSKTPNFIDANETDSENNVTGVRITEDYRKRSIKGSLIIEEGRPKKKTKITGTKCCF
mmetsp:Transcript_11777/g.10417  ORF Transcript_11777/g.10417 Transcript_11777/m.10417 type:complete len:315 (+) Transcript_11777:398-1342(+)